MKETIKIPKKEHWHRIPAKYSGWFFIRAVAEKVDKPNPRDVTAKDIHNFGHMESTIFSKEYPRGERIPPLFYEQIDLELAQEIVDNPNKIWESS